MSTEVRIPEILHYTEGDDSPRFLSRAAFEAMLTEHRYAVLEYLNAVPRRASGPLKPSWVDVLQPDGTRVVGVVAAHDGDAERIDPQSGEGF